MTASARPSSTIVEPVAGEAADEFDGRRARVLVEFGEHGRQPPAHIVNVHCELQRRLAGAAEPTGVCLGSIERPFADVSRLYQALRGRCQGHRSPMPHDQGEPEASFGFAQALAGGRLGDEEIAGGGGDRAPPIQRQQELVVGPVQARHSSDTTE